MDSIIKMYFEKGLYTADDLDVFVQAMYISQKQMQELLQEDQIKSYC